MYYLDVSGLTPSSSRIDAHQDFLAYTLFLMQRREQQDKPSFLLTNDFSLRITGKLYFVLI